MPSAGEELVDETPGGDAEHATLTTKRRSAAITRRIPRPYVGPCRVFIRPPEGPSGSQDACGPRIDSDCGAVLLPRAHRGNSPRKTACRLSSALTGALPRLPVGSGGFLLAGVPSVCRRNIHNGSHGRDCQGKETRDV